MWKLGNFNAPCSETVRRTNKCAFWMQRVSPRHRQHKFHGGVFDGGATSVTPFLAWRCMVNFWHFYAYKNISKLEVHSVERIYLRQWCSDASKPRVAASTGAQYQYVGFSRRNSTSQCIRLKTTRRCCDARTIRSFPTYNKIPSCSAYAMGESNPVPASGL